MQTINELKLGIRPEAAVSSAVLIQSELSTVLTFNAQKDTDRPSPYGGFYTEDAGTAIVEFPMCLVTKFGHPNDEAAAAVPEYRDFEYAICEVFNSLWKKEHEAINSHAFPGTKYESLRHFLIFFMTAPFSVLLRILSLKRPLNHTVRL